MRLINVSKYLMNIQKIIVLIFVGLMLSACEEIVNWMAFHPDTVNVIPIKQLPNTIQEISVTTEDDINIKLLYLALEKLNLEPSKKQSKQILIYFHGNAGNVYHRIPSLMRLRNLGINVLALSYRGYGRSDGSPSEAGIYLDGKAAYLYATEVLGFAEKNIIIMGRSIGTTAAINTAQFKTIAGIILVSPLTSGKAHAQVSGLSLIASLAGSAFDNLSKIKNIKVPVLIIHGTSDQVIPVSMGLKIYESSFYKKKIILIKDAGHNNLDFNYAERYYSSIDQFIQKL